MIVPRLKPTRKVTVSTTEDLHDALAAGFAPDQLEVKPPTAAPAPAPQVSAETIAAHGAQLPQSEVMKAAVLGERQRIAAIEAYTPEGFAALKVRAIEEGMSPGQYAIALLTEQRDGGTGEAAPADSVVRVARELGLAKANSPQPAPHGVRGKETPADSILRTARDLGLAK